METVDFARSFLTFRNDWLDKPAQTVSHKPRFTLNNARIPLDCICAITDREAGATQTFVQGGNCKSERVGVERDIWLQPNADFVPIFSAEQFLIVKTYDLAGKAVPFYPPSRGMQPERQVGAVGETFDSVRIDVLRGEGEVLEDGAQIVQAVLDNEILVARTALEEGRYLAVLEYPVKTINANERDAVYQTDTGPILLPDFSREPGQLIEGFELAFSAFNSPDWIELIVRAPTPVGQGLSVYHYSRPLRLTVENQIIRLL